MVTMETALQKVMATLAQADMMKTTYSYLTLMAALPDDSSDDELNQAMIASMESQM